MKIGYCKYCGNSRMITDVDGPLTEEEMNRIATQNCDCEQARWQAQKERTLEVYDQDLFVLLGEGREDIKEILRKAGAMILEGKIGGIALSMPNDAAIKVRFKTNGLATSLVKKNTQETLSCG